MESKEDAGCGSIRNAMGVCAPQERALALVSRRCRLGGSCR